MNENIKILWNLIEEGFEEMCPLEAQAIENLITNYQEQEVFIGKLLKENEELRKNSVPVAKIEEEIKHLHKNIQDIENVTLFKEKTLKEQTEIELCKYAICVLIRIWEGK